MKKNTPLVSIVTVAYNAEKEIAKTLLSVCSQTLKNFEYILVDGDSSDSTVELACRAGVVDHILSEKDDGLYYAMNRGVDLAKGKYILFLNAGDFLADENLMHNMNDILIEEEVDFVYGSSYVELEGRRMLREPLTLDKAWMEMPFSHQAVFINRKYHLKNNYDYSFKLAADYKLLIEGYYKNATFKKVDIAISVVSPGGVSDCKRFLSINERLTILKDLKLSPKVFLYYKWLLLDEFFRSSVKKILPRKIIQRIILLKYRG